MNHSWAGSASIPNVRSTHRSSWRRSFRTDLRMVGSDFPSCSAVFFNVIFEWKRIVINSRAVGSNFLRQSFKAVVRGQIVG
jgi:hypothetical protein